MTDRQTSIERDSEEASFTASHWRVYGSPSSLYTAKIRPALRYKHIPYVDIWPSADVYELMEARSGHRFMPVVVTDTGETLQDSPEILARIEALHPSPPLFPADPVLRLVAHMIEDFADEMLVVPSMHYRWGFSEQRKWIEAHWSAGRGEDAAPAAARMDASRPVLGITARTTTAIEQWYEGFVARLDDYFSCHRFVLGDVLSLADLALAGSSAGMMGHDPVPSRMLRKEGPRMLGWLYEVTHATPPAPWAAEPKIDEQLTDLLEFMAEVFVPYQLEADAFAAEALDSPSGEALPRFAGATDLPIFGLREKRGVQVYSTWRHQRTADRYATLDDPARRAIDSMLEGSRWLDYLRTPPEMRIEKSGPHLVRAHSGHA